LQFSPGLFSASPFVLAQTLHNEFVPVAHDGAAVVVHFDETATVFAGASWCVYPGAVLQ
jgi:hypothetical protein